MDQETLKTYHAFCNDCWQYFKKYAWDGVNAGMNDINFWEAYQDGDHLRHKYPNIDFAYRIIDTIQAELWRIGGVAKWSKDRCDETFQYCKSGGKEKLPYLMHWIDQVTALNPDKADYIMKKLADLLQYFGTNITEEELKAYSEAGWILRI